MALLRCAALLALLWPPGGTTLGNDASADTGAPPTSARPGRRQYAPTRAVDILHLSIDLTPDFNTRTLTARTGLRFRPLDPTTRELRLDAVDLRIHEVSASERIQAWQNTDTHLIVTFAAELPSDRDSTLSVAYSAEPTAGLYFRTPAMGYPEGDTHLFTQGEAISHRHWFPCFDAPNEKFTSEVICRVPEGMTALSNGRLIREDHDAATGRVAFHWLQDKPHVNYLIAIAAGHFRQLEAQYRGIPLSFHTPPSEFAWAEPSFRDTPDMMAFFEAEIGVRYPWARYAQVCVQDFVAGGMENTSLTILTHHTLFPSETENLRSSQGLVAHELAHQWFGDLVTCKDWSHLWLNEGFATYYEALYDGHRHGPDAFQWNLWNKAQGVLDQANDTTPIVWRGFDSPDEQFSFRAYPKGAWVLHMLRAQLGEELFRRCVRGFLERHAYGNVVTADFQAIIEELSERSFDAFFDQWVYHAGCPQLEVNYGWDEATRLAKLSIRQTQAVSERVLLFTLPLSVRFQCAEEAVDRTFLIREQAEEFFVALPQAPESVRVDPELTVLARIQFTPPAAMRDRQLTNRNDLIGRVLAVRQLADRKDGDAVGKLKEALNTDPFYGLRVEASRALRRIHSDEALEALLTSTTQSDARVRQQVREDLQGFYRAPVIESALEAIPVEQNPDILRVLIATLGPYGSDATHEILLRFLNSESFRNQLADAAIGAMRAQDDPGFVVPLLETLQTRASAFASRDFAQGLQALAHLARNEEDKTGVREFLARQTHHAKPMVRRAALTALGNLGDPKALAVVETFTRAAPESPERKAAEAAIERLRAARRPADDLRSMREEVLGFRNETRDLRREMESLRKQIEALTTAPRAVPQTADQSESPAPDRSVRRRARPRDR